MRKLTPWAVVACLSFVLIAVKPGYSEKDTPKEKKEKKASTQADTKKADRKKRGAKGRLPIYFGKLGISDEQRDKVYAIQAKFRPQILDLLKKIAQLKKLQTIETTGVLADEQKQQLAQFQKEAKKTRELRRAKRAKAKKGSKKSGKKVKGSGKS